MNPRFFSWPTWAAEGRAPHASDDGITPTEMSPLFGHSPVANSPIITTCVGLRPAVPCGRGDRVPPRKPPPALSPGFPRKAISPSDGPPRGGAGSARPQGTLPFHRGIAPLSHQAFVCPNDYVMPRPPSGLATRTRRPRPSEKTTSRAFSGPRLSRPDTLGSASPRRGGLRTPAGMARA